MDGATAGEKVSHQEVSEAVTGLGWRHLIETLSTYVRVASLSQAADVASRVAAEAGAGAGERLAVDLRQDRLVLTLGCPEGDGVRPRDVELARRISAAVTGLGLTTDAGAGDGGAARTVQGIEIGIDALDIAAVRPFWKAVMGYTDAAGPADPAAAVADPAGQGPTLWFQQMDAPRPQRNRIHFDILVPHDEARRRIDAALAAGGKLVSDARAPAFWVLADPEGNEACICTWQTRRR
jgi:4a-hydroxytetrahydrobiopterin dehydratase